MDAKALFNRSIDQATHCISFVESDHLHNGTPCTEWDMTQLLNHMVYELLWVPDLLAGKTVAEVGNVYEGDVLKGSPQAAWKSAAEKAVAAVAQANPETIVHLSYADVPATHYINEIGGDILIHTWDVAEALHCTLLLEKDAAQSVYENTLPRADEFTASGLFGTHVDVAEDADLQTKLLGLFGRRPTIA